MQRAEASRDSLELTFDETPEGIVAFSKHLVKLVGENKLDKERASTINGILQTILRTNESGIDAVKQVEETALYLAKKVRIRQPNAE